jgi:hypothetical protein
MAGAPSSSVSLGIMRGTGPGWNGDFLYLSNAPGPTIASAANRARGTFSGPTVLRGDRIGCLGGRARIVRRC